MTEKFRLNTQTKLENQGKYQLARARKCKCWRCVHNNVTFVKCSAFLAIRDHGLIVEVPGCVHGYDGKLDGAEFTISGCGVNLAEVETDARIVLSVTLRSAEVDRKLTILWSTAFHHAGVFDHIVTLSIRTSTSTCKKMLQSSRKMYHMGIFVFKGGGWGNSSDSL